MKYCLYMFVYIFVLAVTPVASASIAGTPSLPIEQLLRSIAGTTEGRVRISTLLHFIFFIPTKLYHSIGNKQ